MSVKLFAMTCGWLSAEIRMFLAGEEGHIKVPVPAYLVEHPKGRVLFDTGLHPQVQTAPRDRIGDFVDTFVPDFKPGEEIKGRLESMNVDPGSIDYIVNSHLHFDHAGGNEMVPNAKIIIQKREWEAGHVPEMIQSNFFDPADYDHGHQVMQVDGEYDLFGDGSVVTVPTYGHTPGHQSLKVKLASGDVVMAADSCYLRRTLEEMILPSIVADPEAMKNSLRTLKKLQDGGARIFYGHDPDFWSEVPQAPVQVT